MRKTVIHDQIKNIRKAIEYHSADWLSNMLRNACGMDAKDGKNYFFNPRCYPHILFCALAEELIKQPEDAVATIRDIHVQCQGFFSIANLPTFDGQRFLDLAKEKGTPALCEAIESLGGLEFPIELRTPEAQNAFREWMCKISSGHDAYSALDDIMFDFTANEMLAEDVENTFAAIIAFAILENKLDIADNVLSRLCWPSELPENDPIIGDFQTLVDLAAQYEYYEMAAVLRDYREDFMAEEIDPEDPNLVKWADEIAESPKPAEERETRLGGDEQSLYPF